ncbi:MAG: MFS transporter [Anaeromyxobacteraceae bacterium]
MSGTPSTSDARGVMSPALVSLLVVVFIDMLGFGMVIPVMALYAERLGASSGQTGWLMASYSVMQFVFTPIWGRLSDRIGRRPLLLASIAMTSVAFFAYALAPTFGWLLASRLFAGAATANLGIAQAYVADVTRPEDRAKGMGLIGAAFGMGFVLGPAMGGILSGRYGLSTPGFVAGALAAANGVLAWFVLKEPANRVIAQRKGRLTALFEELGKPGIRRVIIMYFLVVFAFAGMESTFALLSEHRYGLRADTVGYVFGYIGVIIAIVQGALIGPLTRAFGERTLLVAGLLLQAVAFVMLPFMPGIPGLLLACTPLAAGSGLSTPALSSILSRCARREDQGGTLGIGQSAAALGRVFGPVTATHVFEVVIAGPYLVGAAIMLAMAALGATLRVPGTRAGDANGLAEEHLG